ncbi:MAG: hypothetical protein AB1468_02290 [Candidatus Micrarchaeota archaeon]
MRGLVSILLVILLLAQLLVLMSAYARHRSETRAAANEVLALEKNYYLEMDVKHALANSVRISAAEENGNREETADAVADRLAGFEKFIEGKYAKGRGVEIDVWCGIGDEQEFDSLAGRMLENKKLEKCASCWDFSEAGTRTRRKETIAVRKCAAFFDADTLNRIVFISRGGADLVDDFAPGTALHGRGYVLGFSILDKKLGVASVAIVPEGTKVRY